MFTALVWAAIGAFVGWNLPQPDWAKDVQTKVTDWFSSLGK